MPTSLRRLAVPVVALAVVLATPGAGEGQGAMVYRRPVDGEVVRPYAPGPHAYGPGHRGVDLAVRPGAPVRAAAAGRVGFAGAVAGTRWVTLLHADGIRTSYGPLTDVRVDQGDDVAGGTVLGTATGRVHDPAVAALHWGARRGSEYLDPMTLLHATPWTPTLVGAGGWSGTAEPSVPRYGGWDGRRGPRWLPTHALLAVPRSRDATGPGWLVPPNPNHVIGVAGLATGGRARPLDLTHLGYDERDITYLSYAGRTDAAGDGDDPWRDQRRYRPEDTWAGVAAAAARLEVQLRAQWARRPDQAVDLVGHSLGGVVVAYYLLVLHDPADPGLPPIGHVATIAAPLEGSDVADVVAAARDDPIGRRVIDLASGLVGGVSPSAQAVDDLAVGSPLLRGLRAGWDDASRDPFAGPLATGTRLLTVGARADVVVPLHRSDLPGAAHVVVPGGHEGVRRTEATRIVLRAFLADQPLPADSRGLEHWLSYPLTAVEQVVGRALLD